MPRKRPRKPRKPTARKAKASTVNVDALIAYLKSKSDGVEVEYRFHPVRRWRFDAAIPSKMLALEYEGGTFGRSRHTSGIGYSNDVEKYSVAAAMGWCVIRVTCDHLKSGECFNWIDMALARIQGESE